MKKFNLLKTFQLILFTVFAVICIALALFNKDLYHAIAADPAMKLICGLLWLCFGLIFIFIYMDFNFLATFKKDYYELEHAAHTDFVTDIANRNSLDELIEQYENLPIPKDLGFIMFDLTNVKEINEKFSRSQGTALIRDFSNNLKECTRKYLEKYPASGCYVGRNGGIKFYALFENSSEEHLNYFIALLRTFIDRYNVVSPDMPIEYQCGISFSGSESARELADLIALANSRIYEEP